MRNRLLFLMLAGISAGGVFALWLMTGGQPGLVNDSAAYIGGAESLLAGRGYSFSYRVGEWTPIVHFPPLFSLLTAGASWLAGSPAVQTAYALNLLLFGVNIFLTGLLAWRMTRQRVWALLAALLFACAPGMLWTHAFALSEPLFLCILLAFLHALLSYVRGLSRLALLAAAVLAALAFWTRFVGAALYLSGALAILFYSPRRPWRFHFRDLGLFFGISLPAALLLMLRNAAAGGTLSNRSLLWHTPAAEKWLEGAYNLWSFFLPEVPVEWNALVIAFVLLAVLGGLSLAIAPFMGKEKRSFSTHDSRQDAALIAMQGCAYLTVLLLAMTFFDASTIFEARILAPFVLCLMISTLATISYLQSRLPGQWKFTLLAVAVIFLALTLISGINLVRTSRWDGLGFSAAYWRDSATFQALEELPEVNIYSTRPMGIFLLSGRPAAFIPDAYNPVTRKHNPEYTERIEQMRQEVLQGEAAVVIFEYPSMTVSPGEVAWARQVTAGLPLLVMLPDGAILGDHDLLEEASYVTRRVDGPALWPEAFLFIVLPTWLVICVVHDLKTRTVPLPLTLLPLVVAGIVRLFSGAWLLPLYVLALVLFSDLQPRVAQLAALLLGVAMGFIQPDLIPELAGLSFTWLLWSFGFTGGADVRMLMALVLLFDDASVLLLIWAAGGLIGLLGLLRKEKTIPIPWRLLPGQDGICWFLILMERRYSR